MRRRGTFLAFRADDVFSWPPGPTSNQSAVIILPFGQGKDTEKLQWFVYSWWQP